MHASDDLAKHYSALAHHLGISFADASRWDVTLAFDGVHFTEEGHRTFTMGLMKLVEEVMDLN